MYINFLIEPQYYRSDRGGTLNAQRLGPYKIRQKNELFNATCVAAAYPKFLLNTLHRRTLKQAKHRRQHRQETGLLA